MGTRKLLRATVLVAVALTFGLLPSTHALAAPTVQEIEAQIQESWEKLEPIIEQYNQIHGQLTRNKAKAAELQKKIQPLQLQVDLAMNKVAEIAASYYKGGGTSAFNALLTSGSPTTLASQLTALDQLAKAQQRQIASVNVTKSKFADEKAKLDELIATQAKQDADINAKRKVIQAEIDRLNQLRIQAYGNSTSGGTLRIGTCAPPAGTTGALAVVITFACSQIGKPYVWGAAGPNSYDCSGLTQVAYAKAGYRITHSSYDQRDLLPRTSGRPGDIIVLNSGSHVGIYLGNGVMVHAPNSTTVVKMNYTSGYRLVGYRSPIK